jgi:hypothetical protein
LGADVLEELAVDLAVAWLLLLSALAHPVAFLRDLLGV